MSVLVKQAMIPERIESRLLYFNDIPSPLGQVTTVGMIKDGTGTDRGKLRVFGSYALAYFLEGYGEYSDANGYRQKIGPGDLALVTPDLPHRYCTRPGRYWSECHVIFDGPLFALCRAQGILNSERPIRHLEPVDRWLGRLLSIVVEPASQSPQEKAAEVTRLLSLIVEIFSADTESPPENEAPEWLATARAILEANLESDMDPRGVAQQLGISYETFRKGFQKRFGVAPALYRRQRRIAVAGRLLALTQMTSQQIAAHLGFADEFHFSKRFKQMTGISPREYRKRETG